MRAIYWDGISLKENWNFNGMLLAPRSRESAHTTDEGCPSLHKEKTRKGEGNGLLRSIESRRDLLLFWRVQYKKFRTCDLQKKDGPWEKRHKYP